mmetsp:Transcript_3056/g.12198  ORF Transcript_3056/g.12198 Transcript_3056/m.12198 type:complete len:340 (+) Transcript_3056:947-1966(+)
MVSSYPSAGSPGARPWPVPKLHTRPLSSSANVCVAPAAASVAKARRRRSVRFVVPGCRLASPFPRRKAPSSSSSSSSSLEPSGSSVRVGHSTASGPRDPPARPHCPCRLSPQQNNSPRDVTAAACRAPYENAATTASRLVLFFSFSRRFFLAPSLRRAPEGDISAGAFPFASPLPRETSRPVTPAIASSESVESVSLSAPGNFRAASSEEAKGEEAKPGEARPDAPPSRSSKSSSKSEPEALVSSSKSSSSESSSPDDAHTRTRVGTSLSRSSPSPSAPLLLLPQQKSAPSAVTHALPCRDAATFTTKKTLFFSETSRRPKSEKRSTRRIRDASDPASR